MNRLFRNIIIISFIILLITSLTFFVYNKNKNSVVKDLEQKLKPVELVIPVRYKIDITDIIIMKENVLVTCYSNRPQETDHTPNITATGRLVYAGSCAVSQDLFRKTIYPGDLIYIVKLNKWFIVEDTTNARHQKLIDIFYFRDEQKPFNGAIRSDVYIIRRR
jgi:3D (Asp-Asp-Asp) domain-containing protein